MSDAPILIERLDGGVALLRLNRPDDRNALDEEMFAALGAAFAEVEADTAVRAAVLIGSGKSFCSGAHHSILLGQGQLTPGERREAIRGIYDTLLTPRRSRLPVVTAVNGHAVAAGAVLALAGDLVLAADSAKIGIGFIKIGLYPAVGLTWWLPRLVGRFKAFEMLALGDTLTAEQAHALGLVTQVHPKDALETEAVALATRLAQGPPLALSRLKTAMAAGEEGTLESALMLDVEYQAICAESEDMREGLSAFMERRDPAFTGR